MNSWKRLSDNPDSFFYNVWYLEGYENSSNIYLLEGDYLTLIDTGNDYTAFFELSEIFKIENIKKVFLTHSHNDHALGLFELIRSYSNFNNFEIILHEAFAKNLQDIVQKMGKKCKITPLLGGEKVNLSGIDFKVVHTPGHTIDSICLYHEQSKTLFSGDAVSMHPIVDEKLGGSLMNFIYSLRILNRLEIKNILPGHTLPAFAVGKTILNKAYRNAIYFFNPEKFGLELAIDLTKAGMLDEAIVVIDDCLKEMNDEEKVNALGLKASILADMKKYEAAIKLFDEISDKNPNAIYSKGMIYLKIEKYEEALKCFDTFLKLNPNDRKARLSKGIALYKLGMVEEALNIKEFNLFYKAMEKS